MSDEFRLDEGHQLHPNDPSDQRKHWLTADDLVIRYEYRREALVSLFGDATPGPDGIIGWTNSSVTKVEREVISPAFELLRSSFISSRVGRIGTQADLMTWGLSNFGNS